MEELEEDEDVVLEGSEFHKALQEAGFTDFQPILINRQDSFEKSQASFKPLERLHNLISQFGTLNIFNNAKVSYFSGKQIATILEAETLLDDHTEFVQKLLNKNSQSFWNKLGEWSTLISSTVILSISYLMKEKRKTIITLLASSAAAIAVHHKYSEFCAIRSLKNLVFLQNELHQLYKKGLRIIRKGFNSKQATNKFSNLDIDRLKFLQPLTETLLKSLANVSRIYYQTSLTIVKILPKNEFDDFLTHFDAEAFNIQGEITYDQLKQLYYVYVMVQSDAMQLLAIAYDPETWVEVGRIPHLRLSRIIFNLCPLVRNHKKQLAKITEDYESCKPRTIQRTFRGPRASKWRDLYLNLDLLSRKVATTYDTIGSILEEIDKRGNSGGNDEDLITELTPRINEIYKQIDSARNFAEFSDLLMVMLKRSGKRDENLLPERSSILPEIGNDLTIVRDSDPLIIDEVFEEYITEEYLKPLYEESDEIGSENAKLDKLLAKNFMSELKEALVDKYKTMSEREAKALLRKNREINGDAPQKPETEESTIPCPPPPPPLIIQPQIVAAKREKREFRPPVPLPRMSAKLKNSEDVSIENDDKQSLPSLIPSPPSPPQQIEISEETERFSIGLPMIGKKTPAFVTFEEEFIGSGENSEEEKDESDNDEILETISD